MLLAFPTSNPHDFIDHLRVPDAPRSARQRTQAAEVENSAAKSDVRLSIQANALPLLSDFQTRLRAIRNVEPALQASPTRLFLHLTLGASAAGGEDPFIRPRNRSLILGGTHA